MVFSPFGNPNVGLVMRSIYNVDLKEPADTNGHAVTVAFSDGARMEYDVMEKELSFTTSGSVKISAEEVVFDSPVIINGSLEVAEDITTDSVFVDAIGDLSNFTTTDGAARAS